MMKMKKMYWILIAFALASFLIVIVGAWGIFSRVSSGYEVVSGDVYFRKFNNLSWKVERREVKNADAETLETVSRSGGLYAKDASHVFFEGEMLTNADPTTFRVLDWRGKYSRDDRHAYWRTIPFCDDPDRLELLAQGYSRDSERVYYGARAIEDVDAGTFVVDGTATSHAHDKNDRYNMGRRVTD